MTTSNNPQATILLTGTNQSILLTLKEKQRKGNKKGKYSRV